MGYSASIGHLLLVACVCLLAVSRVWENADEIMDLHHNFQMGKVE